MSTSKSIQRAVRTALLTSAAAAAVTALPAVAADEGPITEVVVTGTRIRVRDFDAISPVATVTEEAIRSRGNLNIEEVLNTLPQVVPGFSASSNNPSDGTATVDLRGLGPERTLVLVNGRRLNPSTNVGVVDLNNVPTRLVQRVEVVTGGASAVYGSDALAGVVNFVLLDNFEGADLGIQSGQSFRGDGTDHQVDVILGGNFAEDRGNLTAYASWYDREAVLQSRRDRQRINIDGGSSTGVAGRFDALPGNRFALNTATPNPTDRLGNQAFRADGSVRPFMNTLDAIDGGDRYNFAPVNNLLTPAERITLGALGHYDFDTGTRVYTELLFVDSENSAQLAPTPATGVRVDPTSPLLSDSARALLAGREDPNGIAIFRRRLLEVGPRIAENRSKLQQLTFGLSGDVGIKDFKYDAYYSYGNTEFTVFTQNDVSRSRFEAGIAGCPVDFSRFVPGCVAVNPFGAGNISQDAINFIRLNFTDVTEVERNLVSASVNGSLLELPAGPLGFAVGAEWRKDESDFVPDKSKQQGDILGFNAQQPISGDFDVAEVYVEGIIPIVKDLTAIKSLSAEVGARFSDYSSVGTVSAYKAGLDWVPVDGFRVRTMFQRANRAPSLFELFQAGDQGFPVAADPCALAGEDPASPQLAAFCAQQGIADTSSFIQNNVQIQTTFFGNPNLDEETSDTLTAGVVFTPAAIQNLSVSIDYYNIKVDDFINTLAGGAQGIITACFNSFDITSSACNSSDLDAANSRLIFREASGDLRVVAPTVNVSKLETSGIDLQVDYPIPVGAGIRASLLLTYLDEYVLDGVDYKGTTGAANILGSFPEWKGSLRLAYPLGPVTLGYNVQYINAMANQGSLPAFVADFGDGLASPSTVFYHDISAQWSMGDSYELSVGVRNLEDKQPPDVSFGIDQNTDPSTYDVVGRFVFGSFRAKF